MARYSQDGTPPRGDDAQPVHDEYLQTLIRRAAGRASALGGLQHGEVDDVKQDFTLAALEASSAFDPVRGRWDAYVTKVIKLRSSKLLRASFAQKRNHRNVLSLNVHVRIGDEEATTELAHLLTQGDAERRRETRRRDENDAADLISDVSEFISALPESLRELADALQRETISEISRRTGKSRPALYDRMAEIRRRAESAGLAEYLKRRPTL